MASAAGVVLSHLPRCAGLYLPAVSAGKGLREQHSRNPEWLSVNGSHHPPENFGSGRVSIWCTSTSAGRTEHTVVDGALFMPAGWRQVALLRTIWRRAWARKAGLQWPSTATGRSAVPHPLHEGPSARGMPRAPTAARPSRHCPRAPRPKSMPASRPASRKPWRRPPATARATASPASCGSRARPTRAPIPPPIRPRCCNSSTTSAPTSLPAPARPARRGSSRTRPARTQTTTATTAAPFRRSLNWRWRILGSR